MNYQTLFRNNTTLQGPNFTCNLLRDGGLLALSSEEQYPVLFVLAGGLQLSYDGRDQMLYAPEMVIAEPSRISHIVCRPNTIVMEYHLPAALTARFATLPKPVTPTIPITGRLEAWVEDRLLERASGVLSEGDSLVNMLILYQPRRMQNVIDALRDYAAESGFLRQLKFRR